MARRNAPQAAAPINAQQAMMAKNLQARQLALQYFPRQRQELPTVNVGTSGIGSTTRVTLNNFGLTVALHLEVEIGVTIASAVQTLSPMAPYNLIDRITLTDIDGTPRINLTGPQLWQYLTHKNQMPDGYNNEATVASTAPAVTNTPTAIASDTIRFNLEIPIALDKKRDLRGAMLTQVYNGNTVLAIDWTRQGSGAVLANTNSVDNYSTNATGTVTVTSWTAKVWQEVLVPQAIAGQDILPAMALDLNTVNELLGYNKITAIQAGAEYLQNMPNDRTVLGCHLIERNAGAQSYTNLNRMKILAGGATPWQSWGNGAHINDFFYQYRRDNGFDLKPGMISLDFAQQPLNTTLLGQVQLGLTYTAWTPGSTSWVDVLMHSVYTRLQALPGVMVQ